MTGRMIAWAGLGMAALLLVLIGYGLWAPSRFHPVAWQAPPGHALRVSPEPMPRVDRLAGQAGTGPETVIVGPDGALYAGYDDGTVHRIALDGDGRVAADQVIATTNGRPLGLAFGPAVDRPDNAAQAPTTPAASGDALPAVLRRGRIALYVADAERGLLQVGPDGTVRVLADRADATPFAFTDDVTVARNGRIYFTDASSRWPQADYRSAIMEHAGDGRLLVYDPADKTTRVLVDGLQFANGLALSADQDYLLVNETGAYRVRRYWLKGPRTGQSDIVIDDLPGFPDGISRAPGGNVFWIALFAPRNALLDFASDKPALRRLMHRLPAVLQPGPAHVGQILAIDGQGRLQAHLRRAGTDAYAPITSVTAYDDHLYLGSLTRAAIGRIAWSHTP